AARRRRSDPGHPHPGAKAPAAHSKDHRRPVQRRTSARRSRPAPGQGRTMNEESTDLAALRRELYDAQEFIRAVREGEVDAFITAKKGLLRVQALVDADTPYRFLTDAMKDGAVTIAPDGTVLYANLRIVQMLDVPASEIVGRSISDCLQFEEQVLDSL